VNTPLEAQGFMPAKPARPLILIVDDEIANIHRLAQALGVDDSDGKYMLRFASNAEAALMLAQEAHPALILLDVVMPIMDGFAILARLQANPITRVIPVIFVTSRDESHEEARGLDLGAVDYITKPISPAIVRARVRTHLELRRQREFEAERALIDGLTGIANRRHFDECLARICAQKTPALEANLGVKPALLMIDVDHFKQFNDSAGHAAGDLCLQRIAQGLRQAFARGEDLVARIGGEEFAALLLHGELLTHAQRALDCIAQLALAHPNSPIGSYLSVSIGAIELSALSAPASVFATTDALLYQAKRAGRNRAIAQTIEGQTHTLFAHTPDLNSN
jgi:diguanylate cyclase (GGDEF)-like protein